MPGRCSGARRFALYARNDFRCTYCSLRIELSGYGLTLDHVIPSSHTPDDSSENLVVACRRCNSTRQNIPVAEFAAAMARDRGYDKDVILACVAAQLRRKPDRSVGLRVLEERKRSRPLRAVLEARAEAMIEAHRIQEEQRTGKKAIDTCERERRAARLQTRVGMRYDVRAPNEHDGMTRKERQAARRAYRKQRREEAAAAEVFVGVNGGTFVLTSEGRKRYVRK